MNTCIQIETTRQLCSVTTSCFTYLGIDMVGKYYNILYNNNTNIPRIFYIEPADII